MKRNKAVTGSVTVRRLVLPALILGIGIVLASAAAYAANTQVEDIKSRGELVLALDRHNQYPYAYDGPDGRTVGHDVDMAQQIAETLGVKLSIDRSADGPEAVMEKVFRKQADLAGSGLKVFLSDAQKVAFTDPYFSTNYALLVNRREFASLKREGDMLAIVKASRARIGVLNKPFYHSYVARIFPKAELKSYGSMTELIAATLEGEVMAAFSDEVESKAVMLREPVLSIELRWLLLREQSDYLGFAVGFESRHFLSWLNLYLSNTPQFGNVDALLRAYPISK